MLWRPKPNPAISVLYFNTNSVFHCCGQWNEDWKRHLKAAQDHLKVITHWYTWINVVFTTIKLPMLRPEGAERAAGEATFSARCPSKCPSLRSKCMPLQDIFPSWSLWTTNTLVEILKFTETVLVFVGLFWP